MSAGNTPWTLTHISGSNFAIQTFEIRGMFGDKPNVYPIFNRNTSAIDGGYIHVSPEIASLIVRAVNAHDDLVEGLRGVMPLLEKIEDSELVGDEGCLWPVEFARAALRKALGDAA